MLRFIYVTLSGFLFISLFLGFNSGPYPENTGAPGEMTCFRSGCHTGSTLGSKSTFISFSDTSKLFRNDSTYTIHFGVETSTPGEFGVQMVALDEQHNNIGTWIPMGNNLLQVISGISFPNRKYIQHTLAGSASSSWIARWKAPSSYKGKVTFYASFLETNNNNMNSGDTLYKKTLNLTHDPSSGLAEQSSEPVKIYLSQLDSRLIFSHNHHKSLIVSIYDLNGRKIKSFSAAPGIMMETAIGVAGIYLVQAVDEEQKINKVHKVLFF